MVTERTRTLFAAVLWGRDYVDNFVNGSLPTLLAPGNLGGMSPDGGSKLLIVTTEEDAEHFRAAPAYAALRRHIATEFRYIEKPHGRNKYEIVSGHQCRVIHASKDFDALVFLYPDFIFADGTICNVLGRLAEGYDAVVMPVPRAAEETIRPELEKHEKSGAIALEPRRFVEIAARNLHHSMASYFLDAKAFSAYPSTLLWRVADNALLFRCFHLHPIALRVQRNNPNYTTPFRITLDEEYLPRLFPCSDRIYFVEDSDEAAVCSLTESAFAPYPIHPWLRPNTALIAQWAEGSASVLHREFVRHSYRWHSGEVDSGTWMSAETGAADFVDRVLERLRIPDRVLQNEDPIAYKARLRRVRRFAHWRKPPSASLSLMYDVSERDLWRVLILGILILQFWRLRRVPVFGLIPVAFERLLRACGYVPKGKRFGALNEIAGANSARAIIAELIRRKWQKMAGRLTKAE
jgi:hypothetical protein